MEEDSDEDEEEDGSGAILSKMEDVDRKDDKSKALLGPEDAKFSGELADGVNRIRVCPTPRFSYSSTPQR
jgi:hypothetical protein